MIKINDGRPEHHGVGKPAILALRTLLKSDLDLAWRVEKVETVRCETELTIITTVGDKTLRHSYRGPLEEMKLLIGVAAWYKENERDLGLKSRTTSELLGAIESQLSNPSGLKHVERELRDRFVPYANRLL